MPTQKSWHRFVDELPQAALPEAEGYLAALRDYHFGDPLRNLVNRHMSADRTRYRALLGRVLREMDADPSSSALT